MKTFAPVKKLLLLVAFSFVFLATTQAQKVTWLSFEEAIELSNSEKNPKKIFIDVYTDWCGWCKKMDKDTFQNPDVAKYMNANFYMVKLDGEAKKDIVYKGHTYKYVASGRRGYHQLPATLLQGKLSYPTVVFLDEEQKMLSPVPGYHKPKDFMMIAKYFGNNIYKNQNWEDYKKEQTK